MSASEFFYMGGYGFYVWGSYLLTFVVIIVEVMTVVRRRKKLLARSKAVSRSTKN